MPKNSISYPPERIFTKPQIEAILLSVVGKTLGQVDSKGIIAQAMASRQDKVVRGIAGDVIELSVLGCKRDNYPTPDVLVDNVQTELKTTGVKGDKNKTGSLKAKEPVTITNVSPGTIVTETFETSRFLHKLQHLLFVFYHYNRTKVATCSADYAPFEILGHLFWKVPKDSLEKLKKDWELIQNFSQRCSFQDDVEERHKMKKNLMLIDYASPQSPRFRFKQSFASSIVETFLESKKVKQLPKQIDTFELFDKKCLAFTQKFGGKNLNDISKTLGIKIKGKDQCQRLVVNMFGGDATSINQIKDFKELGLVAKTLVLTSSGKRTEDMKMYNVDFQEWLNPSTSFSEEEYDGNLFSEGISDVYSFFNEGQFLFIVFQEPYVPEKGEKIPLGKCIFKGFKRYCFNDYFIKTFVYKAWVDSRDLVFNKTLKEERYNGGYAPNFPKSKDNLVFFRGSGTDSRDKRRYLSEWGIDIKMYSQWIWVKGKYIVEELSSIPFL